MIYVASPFTHPDPGVRARRVQDAASYCRFRIGQGAAAFSTVVYTQLITPHLIEFEHWVGFNIQMMYASECIEVLMLDGWKESRGVQMEIAWAADNNRRVYYSSLPLVRPR